MAQLASEEGSDRETKAANYKRQLRIAFVGEDGIDEGGVQKGIFSFLARGRVAQLWYP
jgi:hypothetical protein